MANPRIEDGVFRHLAQKEMDVLQGEYDEDCSLLDTFSPEFESWLAAKLHDLRLNLNG